MRITETPCLCYVEVGMGVNNFSIFNVQNFEVQK